MLPFYHITYTHYTPLPLGCESCSALLLMVLVYCLLIFWALASKPQNANFKILSIYENRSGIIYILYICQYDLASMEDLIRTMFSPMLLITIIHIQICGCYRFKLLIAFVICNRWHFLLHVCVGVWRFYLLLGPVLELIQQEYALLI